MIITYNIVRIIKIINLIFNIFNIIKYTSIENSIYFLFITEKK